MRFTFYRGSANYDTRSSVSVGSGLIHLAGAARNKLFGLFTSTNTPFQDGFNAGDSKPKSVVIAVDLNEKDPGETLVKEIAAFEAAGGPEVTPIIVVGFQNKGETPSVPKIANLILTCQKLVKQTGMPQLDNNPDIKKKNIVALVECRDNDINKNVVVCLARNPEAKFNVKQFDADSEAIKNIAAYISTRQAQQASSQNEFYFTRRLLNWSWGNKPADSEKAFSATRKIAAAQVAEKMLKQEATIDDALQYKAELTEGELGKLFAKAGYRFKK